MLSAAHVIIYADDAEKARAFCRDVLGLPSVDAGRGWLIFGLPPAELAAHPVEPGDEAGSSAGPGIGGRHQLYLMCDDIHATVNTLMHRGVEFVTPVLDQGWGLLATFIAPGMGRLSIYQPRHPFPPRPS